VSDKVNAPFLRNAWYQAAWQEELDSGILARTIMNEPLVFFRDANGKVGCVEDRCCHRGAPLSHGKVVENGLQCGYHGLVFNTEGKCVEIPGQDNIPPAAQVRSRPVVQRQEFIWVWMGDPALADESKIVDWKYHDDPKKYPHRKATMPIKINYIMMIDNLMDLTHLGYVHTKTIGGNPKAHVNANMETTRTENGAKYIRWMLDALPPPTYVKGAGFTGKIDRWQEFGQARSKSDAAPGKIASRKAFTCCSITASRRRARTARSTSGRPPTAIARMSRTRPRNSTRKSIRPSWKMWSSWRASRRGSTPSRTGRCWRSRPTTP
jgi:phenylpropionate dioxygenase-like ring-hydroxylating dioxygenase large terminal subunit